MKRSILIPALLISSTFLSLSTVSFAADPITGTANAVGQGAVDTVTEAGKLTGKAVTGVAEGTKDVVKGVEKGTKAIVNGAENGYEKGRKGN